MSAHRHPDFANVLRPPQFYAAAPRRPVPVDLGEACTVIILPVIRIERMPDRPECEERS